MRIGQPVTLTADVYGSKVEYHGTVAGFGAGTGAAFSLLPAQNATGNWIKVVQRVPVRIALDPKELAEHPLRIGLSMQVDVDTHRARRRPPAAADAAGDRVSDGRLRLRSTPPQRSASARSSPPTASSTRNRRAGDRRAAHTERRGSRCRCADAARRAGPQSTAH